MSEARDTPPGGPAVRHASDPGEPVWVGWIVFASMMMLLVGTFQLFAGFVALFNSDYYLVRERKLLVDMDFTAWGWTHLVIGAVAVVAGIALLAGQLWARVVGIAMALVSSLVNLAFLSAYPVWSIVVIYVDVLVIYAIAVHGRELKTGRN
jgi:hypothetical protein